MRGIKKLNKKYPISNLWDSGVSGNTDAPEYEEYMEFRRDVSDVYEVHEGQTWKDGVVKILNGEREKGDINAQSIVLRINNNGASILLTGDTDAKAWKDYIFPESSSKLPSEILLGSHHGSITFFDDPRDEKNYYVEHIKKIDPAITVISVGDNPHGHPDDKAVELYEKYSRGSDKGNKIFRTDEHGNIKIVLKDDGGWRINKNQ
jgi:beta-lactamase superfamily II metal-dependent hydrolase